MSRVELLASYWTICGGAEPHTDQEWSPFGLRERAEAASKAGFTGLGIWHADLLHLRERHGLAEMRRILEDNGIRHLELEFLTDWFLPPGERRTASDTAAQDAARGRRGARRPSRQGRRLLRLAGRHAAAHRGVRKALPRGGKSRHSYRLRADAVLGDRQRSRTRSRSSRARTSRTAASASISGTWSSSGIPYERVAACAASCREHRDQRWVPEDAAGNDAARGNDRPSPVLRRGRVRCARLRRSDGPSGLLRSMGNRGPERRASPGVAARRRRATGIHDHAGAVRRVRAMRAAVFHGRCDLRLEDVPEPEAGPGDVKLRVHYNGICGSDLHEYYAGPMTTRTEPHPLTGVKNPVIFGHELCGSVVALGDGVEDLEIGDRVAVEPVETCGHCLDCRSGHYNHCRLLAFHGYNRAGGGLAEYTVVRRSMAHRLPSALSPAQGALIEPMAIAWSTVRRCQVEAGADGRAARRRADRHRGLSRPARTGRSGDRQRSVAAAPPGDARARRAGGARSRRGRRRYGHPRPDRRTRCARLGRRGGRSGRDSRRAARHARSTATSSWSRSTRNRSRYRPSTC